MYLNIIIHPPRTVEGLRDLQKKVAIVHAEAVIKYINKLPCSKKQKMQLLVSVQKSFKY
jgi:hypothetical protein